eukprot:9455775-Pyramimonas_sp.AAC.1
MAGHVCATRRSGAVRRSLQHEPSPVWARLGTGEKKTGEGVSRCAARLARPRILTFAPSFDPLLTPS